ncbi:MAG: ribonuclease [Gallionella sp.]|nr:ribonuclease [Gallionella sp.]
MTYARNFFISLLLMFGLFGNAQAWDHGRSHHHQHDHAAQTAVLSEVWLASLPPEARDTLRLIKQGGSFPYPRDGVVFSNRERILPKQHKGYYHEYTVKTPGISHRGARRIVSGVVGEYYYTGDHYQSFQRIKE